MIRFLLAVIAFVSLPILAQAQDMGGAVGFNNVTNSVCGGSCRQARERQDRFFDVRSLNAIISGQHVQSSTISADFSYSYSSQRTQQNLQRFVERTPVEAGRSDLQRSLDAEPGLMQSIRRGIKSYGFEPDNVADVYAMWWMNVWMAANKQDADPDRRTITMVKQQVRRAFATTRDFSGTSDAQRQEYAEALMLQASMLSSAFYQYKSDPAKLDELADAAKTGAKASGLDLSSMYLTASGFVSAD